MSLPHKLSLTAFLVVSHLLFVGSAFGQNRIPPAIEAANCGPPSSPDELPNARFQRKGGQITTAKVLFRDGELTLADVAQGRDLKQYDILKLKSKARTAVAMRGDPIRAQARSFLFEHWRDHKQAYLTLTGSSVDAAGTSHIFIEQDQEGRWRVSWRIVRDMGEVVDSPTYYSVQWAIPAGYREPGTPLAEGQAADSIKHRLEFRDKCGDIEQTLCRIRWR